MKRLERKDKISLLKRLIAGGPVRDLFPAKDFIYIERENGCITEVETKMQIKPGKLDQRIEEIKKQNPFLNINPIIIKIVRENNYHGTT
jgi:hypothetical protein